MEKRITLKEANDQYKLNNKRIVSKDIDGFVVLKNVEKVYDGRVQAVYNFNLSVKKKEFVVLVGPSGCGKSTTLRMIAGLEEITGGNLYIDGVFANYLESKDRDIAMVFQSYALYPNMTVFDNIAFGLKVRKEDKEVIKKKVYDVAEILDLGMYLDRKPKELSGGQMQRVALGRAIVRNAKVFLMDEPLSNLDAKLRVQMRSEIVKLHRNINATTIYVTHDQTEAMTMADRIVVMNKGIIQQIGTPMEVYNNPRNVFVATFIGTPPMNVFEVKLDNDVIKDENTSITIGAKSIETYRSYIDEKRAFFEKTLHNASDDEENDLVEEIKKFNSTIKKMNDDELKNNLSAIIEDTKLLRESKGYLKITDDDLNVIENSLSNRNDLKHYLKDLISEIQKKDLEVAGILKEVDSSGFFVSKENKEIKEEPKKKKLFAKKEHVPTLEEENIEKAKKYFDNYSLEESSNTALIGIRPENIHFYDEFNGNKSEKISVVVDFVELLGSEFNIQFRLFGKTLIMKSSTNRLVKVGETIDICFDMDRVKMFDYQCGMFVC